MEDDFTYIKNLEISELVDIVSNIWGFEETSEALIQLEKENSQKALELGIEILENGKGDDFLQASVWDIIFNLSPEKVLNSLSRRKKDLGKVLFYDILKELNSGFYIKDINYLPEKVINKIFQDYEKLPKEKNSEIDKAFIEFSEKVKR